ncbi:bifunctional demethylmenaquinone methyltransferase/2-methoxy-6-polyprenyl-1,4-benzoquinol methylase UbiE [Kiloniella laminariae]|uniref:Ubiquinone/menaquinone biosynthesis C-methyltransferase UbiE n=1 Tax=Kiloniella laminariae TaxID=454162 RepID=A0ABT4LIQ5_9PROT|nr:bifunctional demethylmenaquinone methyltransferase/2-methoxy-6-polyprenyl-1,4-benzoquinol methylase UbiE [Kiloniella laminariae]MCZ4280983.1 bifunctional demethylmenaquinone methyltransferase/2-methoxy-6-polyprenyl-1,4-benzoquinol methylase UbiE [Kiloniella laminariae]
MADKQNTNHSPNNTQDNAVENVPDNSSSGTTHFGYSEVPINEKRNRVRGVFESVARNYDLMNDLMSGGIHRLWKTSLIDWLNPRAGEAHLDVAGGTGDIALRIIDQVGRDLAGPVTVCDLTPDMMLVGRDRAIDQGIVQGISWTCGNAESLPFPDRSMNSYTIAFGLRNVTHIDKALSEARRVLKPGGRFFCLEFSQVVLPVLSEIYDQYSFKILPAMGQLIANDRESYQYLAESIRRFPPQDDLIRMMTTAGFEQCSYRNYTGGVAAIHCGWRI